MTCCLTPSDTKITPQYLKFPHIHVTIFLTCVISSPMSQDAGHFHHCTKSRWTASCSAVPHLDTTGLLSVTIVVRFPECHMNAVTVCRFLHRLSVIERDASVVHPCHASSFVVTAPPPGCIPSMSVWVESLLICRCLFPFLYCPCNAVVEETNSLVLWAVSLPGC